MIVTSLCNLIILLITTPLKPLHISQIPDDVLSSVNEHIDLMITYASSMLDLVFPYDVAKVLITIVVAIELGIGVYHFVMWVVKKIPMLGIS